MGASNVTKVSTHWRHLSHREARALAFMANMALDAGKPPVFFGGWEAVASALGLDCEGRRASAERASMQVFAALRDAGAIVSSGQARIRVRAEYAISLDPDFTFQPKGTGRNISWTQVPRKSPNAPYRQVPEQDVQAVVNETFRQVPERNVRESLNETYRPRITTGEQGGVLEENEEENPSPKLLVSPAHASELQELDERPSMEDERSRQLQALEKRMAQEEQERKAS